MEKAEILVDSESEILYERIIPRPHRVPLPHWVRHAHQHIIAHHVLRPVLFSLAVLLFNY